VVAFRAPLQMCSKLSFIAPLILLLMPIPFLDKVPKLHSRYHHYAGVIVDVFYDHFLAKNWVTYSNENLSDLLLLSTNL
jgi:hypothetical protein